MVTAITVTAPGDLVRYPVWATVVWHPVWGI